MGFLAEVPAWYWEVLGAIFGLGLGVWLGAKRQGRPRLPIDPAVTVQGARSSGLPSKPPLRPAAAAVDSFLPATRPVPLGQASDGAGLGQPMGAQTNPVVVAPERPAAPSESVFKDSQLRDSQLRDTQLDLEAKLRAATDLHAREMLERSQQQQADHLRHEKQMEELRQAHANELSHLMSAMVEQVDTMQREHAQQMQQLESELERLRRMVQSGSTSSADALTRPVTMTMGGDMRPGKSSRTN